MSNPVVRIRGSLDPKAVAKLVKGGRESTLAEILRLFQDRYGYGHLDLEVELHLKGIA